MTWLWASLYLFVTWYITELATEAALRRGVEMNWGTTAILVAIWPVLLCSAAWASIRREN